MSRLKTTGKKIWPNIGEYYYQDMRRDFAIWLYKQTDPKPTDPASMRYLMELLTWTADYSPEPSSTNAPSDRILVGKIP